MHEAAEDAGLNLITGKPYPCVVLHCSALCCLYSFCSSCAALHSLRCPALLHVQAKPE